MKLTAEQFIERPPKSLPPLTVIFGAEPLGALEASDSFRDIAKKTGYVEREVFTAESGFDWDSLLAASNALSLFASLRFVEIRIPTGKPGKEGGQAIADYCARLPDDTITLITLPEIDWQGKKNKWFIALESAATMIEAMPVERAHLPRWLGARLARQDQRANDDALEYLADRVEGNLLAAQQEIKKLALLCPPGEITLAVLEDSVANVSRFNPFQLVSAIHDGADKDKAARISRMLDGLNAEGEAPPLILWVLVNELRALMRSRGMTKSGYVNPGKARELERTARRHTPDSLAKLNMLAAKVDRMIKGLDSNNPWDALFQLACGIAGVRAGLRTWQSG